MGRLRSADHEEFRAVTARLVDARPRLDEDDMDRVVRRVTARMPQRDRGTFAARLAVIVTLVLGISFSGAGAGLAISGIGTGNTSAQQQYGNPEAGSGTLGDSMSGAPQAPATTTDTPGASGGSGGSDGGPKAQPEASPRTRATAEAPEPVQATRQISAQQSDELPVTGWAAAPIVALGLLLIVAGLVLRRRLA